MTYAFMDNWGRESIRLSDGSYLNLRDPDYSKVPLWVLAESVCHDARYTGHGKRKLRVGEHLLKGAPLARHAFVKAAAYLALVAPVDCPSRSHPLLAAVHHGGLTLGPELVEQCYLVHDLHEGAVGDATRALKHLVPGIEALERVHYLRLRAQLGLPGPDHAVWQIVKWVDSAVCFNEIAQMWQEAVPEAELYYLAGDPALPIRYEFLEPETLTQDLCAALSRFWKIT